MRWRSWTGAGWPHLQINAHACRLCSRCMSDWPLKDSKGTDIGLSLAALFQAKPVERVRPKTEEVGRFADAWEDRLAEQLDGNEALEGAQVELHGLDEA